MDFSIAQAKQVVFIVILASFRTEKNNGLQKISAFSSPLQIWVGNQCNTSWDMVCKVTERISADGTLVPTFQWKASTCNACQTSCQLLPSWDRENFVMQILETLGHTGVRKVQEPQKWDRECDNWADVLQGQVENGLQHQVWAWVGYGSFIVAHVENGFTQTSTWETQRP